MRHINFEGMQAIALKAFETSIGNDWKMEEKASRRYIEIFHPCHPYRSTKNFSIPLDPLNGKNEYLDTNFLPKFFTFSTNISPPLRVTSSLTLTPSSNNLYHNQIQSPRLSFL